MSPDRREALQMIAGAPLMGLFGGRGGRAEGRSGGPSLRWEAASGEPLWRVFEEPFLSEIAFPLGGIGTGTVSLGGRGQLRDWEIANHPAKGRTLDNTFFALWWPDEAGRGQACILEAGLRPPYRGWMGLSRAGMPGMPRFRSGRFLAAYPTARLHLTDPTLPVEATLEAFNPLIPMNDLDSGLPVAIFYWRLTNRTRRALPVTVLFSMLNLAGVDDFGQNLNVYDQNQTIRGIRMASAKHPPVSPRYGNLALVTTHEDVTYQTRWARGVWYDDQSLFWNDFLDDGRLERPFEEGPSPNGRTDTACLGLRGRLAPKGSATFPFLLAWYFPNRENRWNGEEQVRGKIIRNFYATRFDDAWDVANYVAHHLERLESETRRFQRALAGSTLPGAVIDAATSQISTLRSNTSFRDEAGRFFGFEGTTTNVGCCPLNCTHVWNYEQTLAFLFPALERTMREVDFGHNTLPEGNMAFRTLIPLGDYHWRPDLPAADGQMGTIVKLYREWKLSGDEEWLRRLWPQARRALEYAWKTWDADQDGLMEGVQHNTYDIEFHGPNPMMTVIYLCALAAGEEMATAVGETEAAARYRRCHESGRRRLDAELWNGEYYIQKPPPGEAVKYQFGEGCLSDQMLGQWMAHVVGLGHLIEPERARSAVGAVFRHNWKPRLDRHYNPQRIFALGDEAGLLLCSWPRGSRPALPFVYSDEVWPGIEYQVAAHLIYEGWVEEGLRIVEGVRARHDGERRNPWSEVECGEHYARSMASWSLLHALSGFQWDARRGMLEFSPVWSPDRFRCFWSGAAAWGEYHQRLGRNRLRARLEVLWGELTLERFRVPRPAGLGLNPRPDVRVRLASEPTPTRIEITRTAIDVQFTPPLRLTAPATLDVNAGP